MTAIRVGAVEYLNARPLVHGLETQADLFDVRYDVPAKCAALLYDKSVDLGLIPSIEYLRRPDYRIVPDIAVVSTGPVASVALFADRPVAAIRSIALDSSSRTAVALLRVLCAQWFDLEPKFDIMRPDLPSMLKRCDAALLIGDTALYIDHEAKGLEKTDLGEEWVSMTNLPFVWACWAGRPDVVTPEHLAALHAARARGIEAIDTIAETFTPEGHKGEEGEEYDVAKAYLRENVQYELDERGHAGLKRFFEGAADIGLVPNAGRLRFY